jgi:glycine cleavage system H lipoate-binding protein
LGYKMSKNERKRRCLKVKMEDLVKMGFGDHDGDELGSIYDVDLDSLGDKFSGVLGGFLCDFWVWGAILDW